MGKLLDLKPAPAKRAALIDEFGEVSAKRAAFAPTEKRYGQLADEIKTWYADEEVDKVFTEKGLRYQLDVSARANATTVNIRAAYKKLGLAKFLAACSVTLKALAQFLSEPEVDALTSSAQTGSRSLKTTPFGTTAPVAQGIANRAARPDAA